MVLLREWKSSPISSQLSLVCLTRQLANLLNFSLREKNWLDSGISCGQAYYRSDSYKKSPRMNRRQSNTCSPYSTSLKQRKRHPISKTISRRFKMVSPRSRRMTRKTPKHPKNSSRRGSSNMLAHFIQLRLKPRLRKLPERLERRKQN